MAELTRQELRNAVGGALVDRDGSEVGTVRDVYVDAATDQAEWALVELRSGPDRVFVPLAQATLAGKTLTVAVDAALIASAPRVEITTRPGERLERLDESQERVLYEHYRLPHSQGASDTLLFEGPGLSAQPDPGLAPPPFEAPPAPAAPPAPLGAVSARTVSGDAVVAPPEAAVAPPPPRADVPSPPEVAAADLAAPAPDLTSSAPGFDGEGAVTPPSAPTPPPGRMPMSAPPSPRAPSGTPSPATLVGSAAILLTTLALLRRRRKRSRRGLARLRRR